MDKSRQPRYFRSKAGSRVTVRGKYMGIFEIDFDWGVEEPGGCVEMYPSFNGDLQAPQLSGQCSCHGTIYVTMEEIA